MASKIQALLADRDRPGRDRILTYWAVSPVEYQSLAIDIGCPELKEADSLDELENIYYPRPLSCLTKAEGVLT